MEEKKDVHNNNHRANKRSFQANLKPEEFALVDQVKAQTGIKTDRQLLLHLCEQELNLSVCNENE